MNVPAKISKNDKGATIKFCDGGMMTVEVPVMHVQRRKAGKQLNKRVKHCLENTEKQKL